MADIRPKTTVRPSAEPAAKPAQQQQAAARASRPEPAPVMSLIAEIERVMGVKPILGRTRPRPGY